MGCLCGVGVGGWVRGWGGFFVVVVVGFALLLLLLLLLLVLEVVGVGREGPREELGLRGRVGACGEGRAV